MLKIENLSVRFRGDVTAVDSVDLSVAPGEFVALIGPSGAGKSTLLRSVNGLQKPSEGRVIVEGIGEASGARRLREVRRQVGFVFQLHQLVLRISALANVLTGRLGYHGSLRSLYPLPEEDLKLAIHSLERVGLLDKALKRCDQLSGGERQRVGVARALAQKPLILLADEPVASLDPVTSEKVLRLLHRVCRDDGLTAIVCLHQVDLARSFGERVVAMREGRIVFDGRPEHLGQDTLTEIYGSVLEETENVAASRIAS
jgi:phosphonate transport system ATP-binding protein